MPYRINTSGVLETDTAEEAFAFLTLCAKGKVPLLGAQPAARAKRRYRRPRHRQRSPERPTVKNARPALAVTHGVKIGQVWQKRYDKNKVYRVIQIAALKADSVMPKVLKSSGKTSRKGSTKRMGYKHLKENYKLVKDV